MNNPPLILVYLLPTLVFLAIAGVLTLIVLFWSSRFSAKSKALSKRISDIVNQRGFAQDEHLFKSDEHNHSKLINWIILKAPNFDSLRLMMMRSGTHKTLHDLFILCSAAAILPFALIFILTSIHVFFILILSLALGCIPILYFMQLENSRRKKFDDQLPEALDFLTRALRAGHGLSISFGMVGDELPPPVGTEFKSTFEEINFGLPFEDAMNNLTLRVNSPDLDFLVVGLVIQRETGGNLTELLGNLSKSIRERIKLRGKVRILAAEGKYSGILLCGLPFILGIILSFVNPLYMQTLFITPQGQNLIMGGLLMMSCGVLWMVKIVRIRV